MDSSNGANQQQRYCQTPIMAPPTVATSPPIMNSGNVMNPIHQPTHHPPPPISPHPGGYYAHQTTSHYPTPNPTPPPPMHHQPYYPQNHYYAHGSHHQQQTQQPQQHHGIASSHVPISTTQGSAPQGSQHPHMMGYHHPQSQQHQQHWAPHPHQQQGHHYYHHSPPQQSAQPTQQHGYPPPASYPYTQPHPPPPTPPPPSHTPHSQPMHQQPVPQQHPPPQVSGSPTPIPQMHQQPQPQQTQPNHALMNLSRFVNQSPSPSPRASPSLAVSHHPQQIPQRPPSSPSAYGGHMEHHSTMNGHSTIGANSPVMSPPPAPVMQQPMSPSDSAPQQHMILSQPPQHPPYNVNGGNSMDVMENHNIPQNNPSTEQSNQHSGNMDTGKSGTGIFSNITPGKIASMMNMKQSPPTTAPPRKSNVSESEMTEGDNSLHINQATQNQSFSHRDSFNSDLSHDYGDFSSEVNTSPTSKPVGSPTSSGNGHQMMPVRLQYMHKGARTKANMKKLLQEQHITPNGQGSDTSVELPVSAKDIDGYAPTEPPLEKPAKNAKKRKGQTKSSKNSSSVSMLTSPNDGDLDGTQNPSVVRPGYTKSGKKIGRPRKDPSAPPSPKKQKKPKESKTKEKKTPTKAPPPQTEPMFDRVPAILDGDDGRFEFSAQDDQSPIKRMSMKDKRKVPVNLSDDGASEVESFELPDLIVPQSMEPMEVQVLPVIDVLSQKKGKKKGNKKTVKPVVANISNSTDSFPDSTDLNNIPGSQISHQEAESAVQRIVQAPSPSPPKKGKRKGKKLAVLVAVKKKLGQKRSKSSKGAKTTEEVVKKEEPVAMKRTEPPRLRSRSPKTGDNPPLRISSPRAAKERSVTPASNRSRTGKDKDSGSTTTTPMSSPLLRSPKKFQEKTGVRSSNRQKAMEAMQSDASEAQKDTPTTTLSLKGARQSSRESPEVVEVPKKNRRKAAMTTELPLPSSDSEKSHLVIGKRMSRRKSGSVTGSTDNLSSPSFNRTTSSLSMILSDGSHEMPSDLSGSINLSYSPGEELSQNVTNLESPLLTSTPAKRGRGKRAAKGKRKGSRVSIESESLPPLTTGTPEVVGDTQLVEEPTAERVVPAPLKAKGRRKSGQKKGRRKVSAITVPIPIAGGEEVEVRELPILKIPLKAKAIRAKRAGMLGRPRKQKVIPNVPVPAILGLKKNVKFKATAASKRNAAVKSQEEQLANPLDSSLPSTELASYNDEKPSVDGISPDVNPPKRRRSSATSATNTQVSAKVNSESSDDLKVKGTSSIGSTPTSNPKALRRDSRSVSKDITDVSVVLTDISQSFAAEDSILSRFQSPGSTKSSLMPSPGKVKKETPEIITKPDQKQKKINKKGDLFVKSEPTAKKSSSSTQQSQEFQTRKATLEAEVALLMKDSQIPVIPVISPSSGEVLPMKGKAGKRKLSKSPRRAIDSSASPLPTTSTGEDSVIPVPKVEPVAVLPAVKIKRKYTKGRRSSKVNSTDVNATDAVNGNAETTEISSLALPVEPIASVDTLNSSGIDSDSKTSKIVKRTPKKKVQKEPGVHSPDIVMGGITVPVPNPPTTDSILKKKRTKKPKSLNGTVDSSLVVMQSGSDMQQEHAAPVPLEKPSTKKGKRKLKSDPEGTSQVVLPSTSASAEQQPSTSRFFPLMTPVRKKPKVLAKPCRFADFSKEEDNQKKKMDGPAVKVVDTATRFYRGGELEEVDQEPKLVKEKMLPQTDNAGPWICSFCQMGPHTQKLGDLFGPYFANLPSISGPPSLKRETWMHGDCALWAGRLILVGTYLRRLEETLRDADQNKCNVCGLNGATVCCLRRGCREAVHYPCAIRRFWKMDEQNFHSYCPKHIP